MKIYTLPDKIAGLIFDIDMTLYNNRKYFDNQRRLLIERLAAESGRDYADLAGKIETFQEEYAASHEGRKPSLGNTFVAFGIPIKTSVLWREELLNPEEHLSEDGHLQDTLQILTRHLKMICVTNNPSSTGRRTLQCLGVDAFFTGIIGLDTSGVSKPHEKPFRMAAEYLSIAFSNLVSIGDRYEVDLKVPLSLGMGGILVNKMEDIYSLPGVLKL